ncbi:MAG: hypothetical protein LBU22_08035 [Dysgonamonadaceae bacterium]|jgi:hypothetical protein|nr:hypothetical protein [Dysgonamonadaceae bacterium]
MRRNKWFYRALAGIQEFVLHASDLKRLAVLLFICLIVRIIFFFLLVPGYINCNSDSVSYFVPIDIFHGVIDLYRTPVYIYLIKFFEYLSKDHFVNHLILFQHAVLFLSIIPVYYTLKNTVKNKYLFFGATLFYGCYYSIFYQAININPEGLCIVGSTLLLFLLTQYTKNPRKDTAFAIGFLPLILILLKPVYILLLGVSVVFFAARILFFGKERRALSCGILGWALAITGTIAYCGMNKKFNGEFTISKVTLNNTLANIVISGAYKSTADAEFKSIIEETNKESFYTAVYTLNNEWMDQYKESYKLTPSYLHKTRDVYYCLNIPDTVNFPKDRIDKFVNESVHTRTYILYMLKQFGKFVVSFYLLSLIILAELIVLIRVFFKHRKLAWSLCFSILFVISQYFTISFCGINDWFRLLLPSIPFVLYIFTQFFDFGIAMTDKNKFALAIATFSEKQ